MTSYYQHPVSCNGLAFCLNLQANKTSKSKTRSQAVARIGDRTASQHLWGSRDHLIAHIRFPIGGPLELSL